MRRSSLPRRQLALAAELTRGRGSRAQRRWPVWWSAPVAAARACGGARPRPLLARAAEVARALELARDGGSHPWPGLAHAAGLARG